MTRAEFLDLATAAAKATAKVSGFPAGIAVAQATLESAAGQSQLARDANNYFGIKAHRTAASIALPTTEVVGGKLIHVTARFARYASMKQCFRERDAIIGRLSLYEEA